MKINVAVFFGCRSVEHEVSIISAVQAMNSIDRDRYEVLPVYVAKNSVLYTGDALFTIENYRDMPSLLKKCRRVVLCRTEKGVVIQSAECGLFAKKPVPVDVAFPIVHGTNCEDGTMQGYFEFLDLPYVGCDIVSSAVGMDKAVFKDVLARFGLPVLPCRTFLAREYAADREAVLDRIEKEIGYPVIVKPVNLGSSVGITKASDRAALCDALDLAVSFADKVLTEHAVEHLREINCSVLGDSESCRASVPEEPFMNDEILSYEDKYMGGGKKKTGGSKGMASLSRKVPADLSESETEEIKKLSCEVFRAVGCAGVVRIDYLLDTETNKIYANEINTIPGSLAFYLWEATGLSYKDELNEMIDLAFKRKRNRGNLTFTINTNILSGVSFGGAKGAKGAKTK